MSKGKAMRPFLYCGHTELSRVCIGIEYIGGNGKYGLMLSFLWWFTLFGLGRTVRSETADV